MASKRLGWRSIFHGLSSITAIPLSTTSSLSLFWHSHWERQLKLILRPLGSTAPEGSAPHAQRLPGNGNAAPPDATTQEPAGQEPAGQQNTTQEPAGNDPGRFVFKKQVQEIVLQATVVDERRHLVRYLDRGAFSVFENGAPLAITSFRREDVPVAMGIVIDNSGSMRDKRDKVNQAVLNLIRASNPRDEIFVVNFSQNYYLDQDFTSDPGLLERALHQVSMQGSTALYDAIVASAVHLKNNPRRAR